MRPSVATSPGWLLLVVALAAAGYSVAVVPSQPSGPTEVTYRLQAESLARDGDLAYEEEDRLRFEQKPWTDRETMVVVALGRDGLSYQRPLPYALALAPFVRFAPERGPLLLNYLLLAALAVGLSLWLSRTSPKSAPYWSVALVFGTPVFVYARAGWAELFVGAVLAGAYCLTGDAPRPSTSRTGGERVENQVPAAPEGPRRGLRIVGRPEAKGAKGGSLGLLLRWLGVGALTALATLQEPLYAAVFLAFLAIAFWSREEAAWAPAVGGFAVVLLVVWFSGGSLLGHGTVALIPDDTLPVRASDSIEDVKLWTQRLDSVESTGLEIDPLLWLWNAAYALVGRHVGVVAPFLPLVLLVATSRWRRGLLWGIGAAVALAMLVLDPFNFFGGPEALTNRRLVPILILCFFSVRASLSLWPALVAGAVGVTMVAPLWLDLGSHPRALRAQPLVAPVAERLPFETSQRQLPVRAEAVSRRLLVRPTSDGIEPGSGRSQFVLRGGETGEMMIAVAGSLPHLDLDFGKGAGTDLTVRGAEVKELLFRPEGGVTFRLNVEDPFIRHTVWGREGRHDVYMLKISMPGEGERDQEFSVSTGKE